MKSKQQLVKELRELQIKMVHQPENMKALFDHPIVKASPTGAIIAAMTVNAMISEVAVKLENSEDEE